MKKLMMAAMVAAAMVATADNWSFTYQAELKDEKGEKPITGSQNVEIRLWRTAASSAPGDLLWGRLFSVCLDDNGLFNLEVSDDTGSILTTDPTPGTNSLAQVLTSQNAGAVYIGLTVQGLGATEIAPRQRIFAVPYAGKANRSIGLTGATSPVEGIIEFKEGGRISSSGIELVGTNSTISADRLDVGAIRAEGNITAGSDSTISAGNLTFTGKLLNMNDANSREVIPVPIGGIIIWTKAELPDNEHWAVCDGQNGTPDLRGQFVVGVNTNDSDYAYGKTGGAATVKLNKDQMPSHDHTVIAAVWVASMEPGASGKQWGDRKVKIAGSKDDYVTLHGRTELNMYSAGRDQAHENRPPYYALYYIMRVK